MSVDKIIIKGARHHNLKNINLELPRYKLIVVTGLSGSGKSSLAFDTIYAEGQRRYVESLSAYARQYLDQLEKPDVDYIEGLSPAISIEQKTTHRNPRSTVGTVTEIYDYFRLLFARCGDPHCPECGKPIHAFSVDQIIDVVLQYPEKTKIQVLSPIARGKKGTFKKEMEGLKKQGFIRLRIDGEVHELENEIELDKNLKHNIEVIVDRIVIKEGIRTRIADSIETALKLSDGMVQFISTDIQTNQEKETLMSTSFGCSDCGLSFPEIQPRMFSFNNPYGGCEECQGIGEKSEFDPDLIVPDENKSIMEGALTCISNIRSSKWYLSTFKAVAKKYRFSLDTPFKDLSDNVKHVLFYGSNQEIEMEFETNDGKGYYRNMMQYEGLVTMLKRRYAETTSESQKEWYESFLRVVSCPACHGKRLKPFSLAVKINGKSIVDLTDMPIKDEIDFFQNIRFDAMRTQISEKILKEIIQRLTFLKNVGVGYLDLSRKAGTLSGGEMQRIRLATQIGSQLVGVLYVLDEPTIGLHQRDNQRLIDTLLQLRDIGNTLIVVEHDEQMIRNADYVVDLGPGAGIHGGNVVAEGTPEEIIHSKTSVTGKYLSGEIHVEIPHKRQEGNGKFIRLKNVTTNNLKNVSVDFPLGKFIAVTGVSGSGKSSLINNTLYPLLEDKINRKKSFVRTCEGIEGWEHVDKVINIDQSPIGRTPRSNPATYTGLFTPIRELFSNLPEAKIRGYNPGRFSFNVSGGRCETCEGAGQIRIEMAFLSDIYITCDVCKGKRYNRETLDIRYRGKNISDVLDMSIEEAHSFFENIPSIERKLKTLNEVGLSYIKLGQSATTLSGGEAQRVKLASELSRRSTGKTLYLLDEPTTGLHFDDVRKLIEVLLRFVENGNTVLVIEHNLDVIKVSDWVIDLGPEGGVEGGNLVCSGTPEELAQCKNSHTGKYLKDVL